MKNTIFKIVSAIILAATLFVFTGCEKKKDEISQTEIQQSQITTENLISGKISVEDLTTEQKVSWLISVDPEIENKKVNLKKLHLSKEEFDKVLQKQRNNFIKTLSDEEVFSVVESIALQQNKNISEEELWKMALIMKKMSQIEIEKSNIKTIDNIFQEVNQEIEQKKLLKSALKVSKKDCPILEFPLRGIYSSTYNRSCSFVTRADNSRMGSSICDYLAVFVGTSRKLKATSLSLEMAIAYYGGTDKIIMRQENGKTQVLIGYNTITGLMIANGIFWNHAGHIQNNLKLKV